VSSTRHSAKTHAVNCLFVLTLVCRVSAFAECSTLGKKFFAECFSLPSVWHSAKEEFTVCFPLLSAALGKEALCWVHDILHSAKPWTLGKGRVSGSDKLARTLFKKLTMLRPFQGSRPMLDESFWVEVIFPSDAIYNISGSICLYCCMYSIWFMTSYLFQCSLYLSGH
jgi:hypothetical protein